MAVGAALCFFELCDVLPINVYGLVNDELCDPVPALDGVGQVPEVDEVDEDFTRISGIDHAGGVEHGDTVFCCQAATGADITDGASG